MLLEGGRSLVECARYGERVGIRSWILFASRAGSGLHQMRHRLSLPRPVALYCGLFALLATGRLGMLAALKIRHGYEQVLDFFTASQRDKLSPELGRRMAQSRA